ncbi:MAG: transglutaminase domain-containing protein [Bacteroidota bacterium]
MCFTENTVKNLHKWNWDGDVIIHNPIVPSSRPAVGEAPGDEYDIDVREFMVTEKNALIQRVLKKDIERFIRVELKGRPTFFRSKKERSFDYRAHVILAWVSENIAYLDREAKDSWQFPDETIHLKTGDCDDRALLLASLLISSGISTFNVRVALGQVEMTGNGKTEKFDHLWVMYKSESGHWTLLEPLVSSNPDMDREALAKLPGSEDCFGIEDIEIETEYVPHYLFNDCHLWGVLIPGKQQNFQKELINRKNRSKWSRFNPKFAGEVHRGILRAALNQAPAEMQKAIDRYFSRAILGFIGPIVDDFDRGKYNPLIHFDNCFITESWDLVNQRLAKFKSNGNPDDFFCAAHSIADFYAHTSYVHFATIVQQPDEKKDYPVLFDPKNPAFDHIPSYYPAQSPEVGFDLTGSQFTVNKKYWKGGDKSAIAKYWDGKIISGRYAQPDDTWSGVESFVTEGILSVIPKELLNSPDFDKRGWAPHHNEIAVDNQKIPASHVLYNNSNNDRLNRGNFKNQLKWRTNAAIEHIRKAFNENRKP